MSAGSFLVSDCGWISSSASAGFDPPANDDLSVFWAGSVCVVSESASTAVGAKGTSNAELIRNFKNFAFITSLSSQ
ncbi:MAG: hypothetical protein HUJ54_14245 [Erysipelotrichaceae bacterium]|nr:hypothetical protein [Erysipelotrichaceae bacterium]